MYIMLSVDNILTGDLEQKDDSVKHESWFDGLLVFHRLRYGYENFVHFFCKSESLLKMIRDGREITLTTQNGCMNENWWTQNSYVWKCQNDFLDHYHESVPVLIVYKWDTVLTVWYCFDLVELLYLKIW